MIAKMEPESEADVASAEDQVKSDPDGGSAPEVRADDKSQIPIHVKKEAEESKFNLSAVAVGENMFDEVDGPEFVDLTYQGIAEVDGVEHFVCESKCLSDRH